MEGPDAKLTFQVRKIIGSGLEDDSVSPRLENFVNRCEIYLQRNCLARQHDMRA